MLRYIIGISIVTSVVMLLRLITDGRIKRKYQYAMWLVVPIFMLLFPVSHVKVTLPKLPEVQAIQETPVAASDVDLQPAEEVRPLENEATAPVKRSINWEVSLRNISLSVSAIILGLLAVYNIGFVIYCIRRRFFLKIDQESGLKVYRINNNATPFLLGKSIYVNANDEEPSRYILCHEACHYRHKDMYWIVLRYIVLALNWYNPLIWAAFIQSGRDCEFACDEEVLKQLGQDKATEYGEMLIDLMSDRASMAQRFSITTGMRGTFNMMKKRITNIKHPNKNSKAALGICVALVLAVSGCSLVEYGNQLSIEDATALALSAARMDNEEVTVSSAELVDENGRLMYEIEFVSYGDVYRVYQYDMDANTGELVYACCDLEEPRYPLDERLFGEWEVTEDNSVMSFVGEDEILGYTFNGDNTGCVTVLMDGEETDVEFTWTASEPYITFYVEGVSIPRATYTVEGDVGLIMSQGTRELRRQS
ncbi:MAG: PepSY domain-containing protein [Clostridiales bacterium]|nr:PepSY domain-containing protein [Clostridiales bacterium]